jgi:hypothetical protein
LKARKHFFKVFSDRAESAELRHATPRDETPLARFQCAATVPACREHPRDAARKNLGENCVARPCLMAGRAESPQKEFDRLVSLRFTRGSSQ